MSKIYKITLVVIIATLLFSCAFTKISYMYSEGKKLVNKYGIITKGKYYTEKVYSNSHYNDFYYDKAFILNNIFISDSVFSADYNIDGMPIRAVKNPMDYICIGNEIYLFIYRNYIDYCDDWIGAISFNMVINLVNNTPNEYKSLVKIDGGELPDNYWDIKLVTMKNDSIYVKGVDNYTNEINYFKAKLVVDSSYSIDQYRNHVNEYMNIVNELRKF